MEFIHEYRVEAIGAVGRNGVVHAEGILPAISFSPPPEFQGEVGRWTPEHLLVAAVASCFISPSPSGKKRIVTGPFAFLRKPRNRAWSHGPLSAKSLSSLL